MPELPISGLSTIGTQGNNDYFPVVEFSSGITKKETRSQLKSYLNSNLAFLPLAGGTMTEYIGFVDNKGIKHSTGTAFLKFGTSNAINLETTGNIALLGAAVGVQGADSYFATIAGYNSHIGNSTGTVAILGTSVTSNYGLTDVPGGGAGFLFNPSGYGSNVTVLQGRLVANSSIYLGTGTAPANGAQIDFELYNFGTSGTRPNINYQLFTAPSAASTATYIGVNTLMQHFTSQNIGDMYAHKTVVQNASANSITNAVGRGISVSVIAGATITNFYHYKIDSSVNGGTLTNSYGLHNANGFMKGTNKWFLYNEDATVNSLIKGQTSFTGFDSTSGNYVFRTNSSTVNDIFSIRNDGLIIGHTSTLLGIAPDTDGTHIIGRAKIGSFVATDTFGLAHYDHATATNYALQQLATGQTFLNTATGTSIGLRVNDVAVMTIGSAGLTFVNAKNIAFATTTGTIIGVATTQKFAFWGKTPIIQPTTGITGATRVGGGGTTITSTDTFGGYTLAQLAAIIINTGLAA